jgi:hypothetical protein
MEARTVGDIPLSEVCLAALVFFYSLNVGPMMFESFTSDRFWAAQPPDSFHMFLGPYGHKTAHYWRVVSPLALLSFVLSVIFNWHHVDRRLWLLMAFAFYLVVQASTMAYFVPEQEKLISSAGHLSGEVLRSRTSRWLSLNYFRNVAGVLAFVFVLLALVVPETR